MRNVPRYAWVVVAMSCVSAVMTATRLFDSGHGSSSAQPLSPAASPNATRSKPAAASPSATRSKPAAAYLNATRSKPAAASPNATDASAAARSTGDAAGGDIPVSVGLGAFAGADYACAEKDIYRKAKFAEGICVLACRPARDCSRALAVCRAHGAARCAGVDVNVEGTVATLKADSEAARRTSRAKAVLVRRRDELAAAAPFALEDYACEGSGDAEKCVLDCPRRNCTGAIGRCYEHAACVAVELKGGSEAFATLKRRRRPAP